MVAAFQEIQDGPDFKVGDRVRGDWQAARNKFGKVVRVYQKRGGSNWWVEVQWDAGNSSNLRTDQIALVENESQEAAAPDLQVGDKVRILYCEGDDPHNQLWCDRVGVVNRLHPNRASNQVQVDFNDQDQEQHWAFDYSLVQLMERGTSETDSEVEELPILDAIASADSGELATSPAAAIFEGVRIEQEERAISALFAEINKLDAQGQEAEQTAIAAGRAALEIRREQGRKLQEAKDQVVAAEGYGSWGQRFRESCPGIHIRSATNYMRLHREWNQIEALAGERLQELTLREAIALLQNKPALQAAPEPEPQKTFEELQELFAPWGQFERAPDPKFKYKAIVWAGKEYFFRGLNEAARWHGEHCFDWNTIEARQKQAQEAAQAKTCIECQHHQLIEGGDEFRCHARGSEHGVAENLAPGCRHHRPRFMDVPPRVEGAPVAAVAIAPRGSETVSEVVRNLDNFDQGPQAGDRIQEVLTVMPEYPAPHPAGVLASSARNGGDDDKDERYTPSHVWQACLKVVGGDRFDLDPATNDRERPNVPCNLGFTKADDGLQQDWSSESIWLNPPYSQMEAFVKKYLATWGNERFTHGFLLAKGDFSTKWAQHLLKTCTVVALIDHRLTFGAPDRQLETSFFASMLFYHGPAEAEAIAELSKLGTVLVVPGVEPVAPAQAEGRAGLDFIAESIALQEQRYAELIDECLQVGDRVTVYTGLRRDEVWEVVARDGDEVDVIGPMDGKSLLRTRENPARLDISEIRRIVGGAQ